jgi:SAM-dependent methyltransferase
MILFFEVIKFLLTCFFSFNSFKKKNILFFDKDKKYISFNFFTLFKILYFLFLNKIKLIFSINSRLKFYESYQKDFGEFKFNTSWFSGTAYHWNQLFLEFDLYKKSINILEIGSFEGQSTLFFLKKFKNSKISCVDPWINYDQNTQYKFENIENQFDKNISTYKDRVIKFKMFSDQFFDQKLNNDMYDIIYVDGDHHFKSVYKDLINSFEVLKVNGLMIIDDFLAYNFYKENLNENPFGAVIVFLNKHKKNIKFIKLTNQLVIQKT